jgi:hypothetical protein
MKKEIEKLMAEGREYSYIMGYIRAKYSSFMPKDLSKQTDGFQLGYLYSLDL